MSTNADSAVVRRVNDLYWRSDLTVTDLLGELDLSRNALYGALEPLAIGEECPECGAGLEFTNRSNRTSGRASCPECGRVVSIDATEEPAAASTAGKKAAGKKSTDRKPADKKPADRAPTPGRDIPPPPERSQMAVAGAVALGGLALGALTVYAVRRLS